MALQKSKVSTKSKNRFLQHRKMLEGYNNPNTEVKTAIEDAKSGTSNKIATTVTDIEEFRDMEFPLIRQEDIENYDGDIDEYSSGEMDFEDYL